MARRHPIPPPLRCAARSKRSGQPCRLWAIPGAAVCYAHGGASPQAQRTAALRTTLATLLALDPRPAWTVVQDHLHTLDSLAREARIAAMSGETITPESLSALVDLSRSALQAAKLCADLDVAERQADVREAELHRDAARLVISAIDTILAAVLDEVPHDRRQPWRDWSHTAAAAVLRSVPVIPEPPRFPAAIGRSAVVDAVLVEPYPDGAAEPSAADSGPHTRDSEHPPEGTDWRRRLSGGLDAGRGARGDTPTGHETGSANRTTDPATREQATESVGVWSPADDAKPVGATVGPEERSVTGPAGVVVSLAEQRAYLRSIGRDRERAGSVIYRPDHRKGST
jgi:hypothetical protein